MKTILRPSTDGSFVRDAIRDLVVVVVGILVALWLESWWQDQQDRREERQILTGLRDEFNANAEELKARMETWRFMRQKEIDKHELMGSPVNDDTVSVFQAVIERRMLESQGFFFDPRHGQLTSTINSGKLVLISNPHLRAMIADWPALVADHDYDEQLLMAGPARRMGALESQYISGWPDSKFENRYGDLMQDKTYDDLLDGSVWLLSRIITEGEEILELTDAIVKLINTEIGT
jgi:hypothetical protein